MAMSDSALTIDKLLEAFDLVAPPYTHAIFSASDERLAKEQCEAAEDAKAFGLTVRFSDAVPKGEVYLIASRGKPVKLTGLGVDS